MQNKWFSVDKQGLGKILERRGGRLFAIFELIQNAWDGPFCLTGKWLTSSPIPAAGHRLDRTV